MVHTGQIIILNGAPRSGKSSIAAEIVRTFPGAWENFGVDRFMAEFTPEELLPGIGLRPGGERPDLEPAVVDLYAQFHAQIVSLSRSGINVVVDVGYHDWFSQTLGIWQSAQEALKGLPVLVVGVHCPLDVILERRQATGYLTGKTAPEPVVRWQEAVHKEMQYDLEVDSSQMNPSECAALIAEHLAPNS